MLVSRNDLLKSYNLNRQFLHSYKLKFKLPNKEVVEVKKELPNDLEEVLNKLNKL